MASARFWIPFTLALLAACGGDDGGGPAAPVDEGEPAAAGCSNGALSSGALYRVCFPGTWNGELVIYAHGYVRPDAPLELPSDVLGGTSISTAVNALGYAYATTSYRANGLVADVAVEDIVQLVETVRTRFRPDPSRTFLVGGSEGGLVAALGVEREPDVFAGGIAACGPIGDFAFQIDYFGDFRALFDYFFPGVLPGSPIAAPSELRENWESEHVPAVLSALVADPQATIELLSVSGAPVEPLDPQTIAETVIGILWYNAFATNDAVDRLGGQPYDNTARVYQGSSDDAALNAGVTRYAADPAARAAIGRFQTTGQLTRPLVTLHTTGDPIVPAAHQGLYDAKTAAAGAGTLLDQSSYDRYGHCTFQQAELLAAFNTLVARATP